MRKIKFTRGIAVVVAAMMMLGTPVSGKTVLNYGAVVVEAAEVDEASGEADQTGNASEEAQKEVEEAEGDMGAQDEETPADEETSEEENKPVDEEKPVDEKNPVDEEKKEDEEKPADEEKKEDEENPADEEKKEEETPVEEAKAILSGTSHVQGIGWQPISTADHAFGTFGEARRIEAVCFTLDTNQKLELEYRVRVMGDGWESEWKKAGEIAGTVGESKAIEAIAFRLTGEDAEKYELSYAAYLQKLGWLNYVEAGEAAGNSMGLRMEAFHVSLRKKGEAAPANRGSRDIGFAKADISYRTHVQNIGWQAYVQGGETAGTSGQSKRLEAIQIHLDTNLDVQVEYKTHIQGIGWESTWRQDDELSGTSGESRRLEAIEIRLTGSDADLFDVAYRVHAQKFGWLSYAANSAAAGTSGFSLRLEALQIRLVPRGSIAFTGTSYVKETVSYRTHMQSTGWTDYSVNGAASGVTGEGKRMEAFLVQTEGTMDIGIEYRSHIQGIGWEREWKKQGSVSGTMGEGRRVEAIQLRLTGADREKFDIYYCVHAQKFGWLGWTKNGETAGTMGHSLRIEAIRIMIVPKGAAAPGKIGGIQLPMVQAKLDYTFSGSASSCSLAAKLDGSVLSGSVIYRLYEPDDAWMYYRKDGVSMTAVHGAERVQMELTGDMGKFFDIYYRTYVDSLGWTGWAKNGQDSGSFYYNKMITGLQVKLVAKGEAAPGSTDQRTFQKFNSQAEANMFNKAQNYYSTNGWLILVNKSEHLIGVFNGDEGNYTVNQFFPCTVGAPGTETIEGDFRLGIKMYYFDSDAARLFYASQISGNYLFHSVLYYQDDYPREIMDGRIGEDLSHGCVRMNVNEAKWIYDNVPGGTRILIYH